jgi:membrane associated rhomboid family serine protease
VLTGRRQYPEAVRYSGADRDDQGPWFRIGALDVTTTVLVVIVWCATVILYAVQPVSQSWMEAIALIPDKVSGGEVWRVVTWPFSHPSFGFFEVIGVVIFWYFGTELEKEIGRRPLAILLGATTLIIGIVASVVGVLLGNASDYIAGLSLLGFTVIGLYIAEHPHRPFFFSIPAWVVGAIYAAVVLIQYLHDRDWLYFLTLIVSAGFIALAARKVDLLSMYDRVPNLHLPGHSARADRRRTAAAPSSGRAAGPARETKRPGSLWGKRKDNEPAEIVQMPAAPRRRAVETSGPDMSADDLALDLLLDKIADGGLDSLSADERQSLEELRARRRGSKS